VALVGTDWMYSSTTPATDTLTGEARRSGRSSGNWKKLLAIDVTASMMLARATSAEGLKAERGGVIVKQWVWGPGRDRHGGATAGKLFAATKGAVMAFQPQGLALSLAPEVAASHCLAPGWIRTGVGRRGVGGCGRKRVLRETPLQRLGSAGGRWQRRRGSLSDQRAAYLTGQGCASERRGQ